MEWGRKKEVEEEKDRRTFINLSSYARMLCRQLSSPSFSSSPLPRFNFHYLRWILGEAQAKVFLALGTVAAFKQLKVKQINSH